MGTGIKKTLLYPKTKVDTEAPKKLEKTHKNALSRNSAKLFSLVCIHQDKRVKKTGQGEKIATKTKGLQRQSLLFGSNPSLFQEKLKA